MEIGVLAEELVVLAADSSLWHAVRPLLDVALRLEQNDAGYSWHGWDKLQIEAFLAGLPSHCSLIAGIWETLPVESGTPEQECLVLGVVCEVVKGQICSIRTFEELTAAGLKPVRQLEPSIDDALEIMRVVRLQVAPAAWALFTERETWNEWLFASRGDGGVIDKGELLASLARQGRCVLMGSQAGHHY